MLCQNCKKESAVVYVEKIINNNKVEINLCEKCAKNMNVMSFDMPIDISNFFSNFISPAKEKVERSCNRCYMTYSEFKNTGKLGCSDCYEAFSDGLDPLLKRIHGNNKHLGKIPEYDSIEEKVDVNKEDILRNELNEAIAEERYEDAAKLRDEIRMLER